MSSLLLALGLLACASGQVDSGSGGSTDGGSAADGGTDGGSSDGGSADGGAPDGGAEDGGAPDGGGDDGGGDDGGGDDGGGDDGGGDDGGAVEWGDCALQSDLVQTHYWEGDTVAFSLACAGSLATEDAVIEPLDLPVGATWDSSAHAVSWTTGPADGGRWDLHFSVRPLGADSEIPTVTEVTFWVADDPTIAGAVAPDPTTYTEEWGLPVIHVDTTGTMSTSYQDATVTWQGVTYDSEIKIRGATSAYYPKPSYTLDFDDRELPLEDWGVEREHLVLLTTFDDNSYVRQKLVYDQWQAIAEYWEVDRLTPRTFYVVVYMDGAYWGLYVALDFIDDEFASQMGFDDTGNLYKAVNHDANFYLTNSGGGSKSTLHDGYEKKQGADLSDFSDLDELVGFTGASGYQDLVDGAADWFSLQEFMDWFLLVNYSLAEDSAGKNSYLYHEPVLDQWFYTPWDFNHSWGQNWYTLRTSSASVNTYTGTNKVFAAIQGVDATEAELWDRFATMRVDGPFQPEWIEGTLDAYYAEIDDSAARDWAKWGSSYNAYSSWSGVRSRIGDLEDYEGEKAYVYEWVRDRADLYGTLVPD